MKFFDPLITAVDKLFSDFTKKNYAKTASWRDLGSNQIIMRRDTAFELDGTGFNLITSDKTDDEIIVVGDDLNEIGTNRRFARISVVQIDDVEDEQKAYNLIKKIEYVKYHTFPDGYMMRSTSRSHKESVRVSVKAVKSGISFQKIGSLLIEKYKENPAVKGVRIIFVTAADADYSAIEKLAEKNSAIAETLNHVMNSIKFDCDTCNLKAICDEVEGMKELHFRNSSEE